MIKIGVDFDDVLAGFVNIACELCNKERGTAYTKEDITAWGYDTCPAAKDVSSYYNDDRVYEMQQVQANTKMFMRMLRQKADVYIMTAVPPERMSYRASQIKEAFPDFPDDHILMGAAKNLVKFDIMLDDAPHNILKSCAEFPVVFRQPWNRDLSGILSVNNYEEFLVLVDQIKNSHVDTFTKFEQPSIIALVGPSGSNKKLLAKMLAAKTNSAIVKSGDTDGSDEQIVSTYYAGRKYGLSKAEIDENLGNDRNVIVAVDMCGAMALKRSYPVTLVFCKAHRENMILDILSRVDDDAFAGYKNLKEIKLSDDLESIGCNAFRDCKSITNLFIPDSVENIGNGAFAGCENLSEIDASEKLLANIDIDSVFEGTSLDMDKMHAIADNYREEHQQEFDDMDDIENKDIDDEDHDDL